MAFKELSLPDTDLGFLYNVTMAVGPPHLPNQPDDVTLVQLCLQQIFESPGRFDQPPFSPLPGRKKVKVDGICGPITRGQSCTSRHR